MDKSFFRLVIINLLLIILPLSIDAYPRLFEKVYMYESQRDWTIEVSKQSYNYNGEPERNSNGQYVYIEKKVFLQKGDTIIIDSDRSLNYHKECDLWKIGKLDYNPKQYSEFYKITVGSIMDACTEGKLKEIKTPFGTKRRLFTNYNSDYWNARYDFLYTVCFAGGLILVIFIILITVRIKTKFMRHLYGFWEDHGAYLIVYISLIIYQLKNPGYCWWILHNIGYGWIWNLIFILIFFYFLINTARYIIEWLTELSETRNKIVKILTILSAIAFIIISIMMTWQENKWILIAYAIVVFRAIVLFSASSGGSSGGGANVVLYDEKGKEVRGHYTDSSCRTFYNEDDESYYDEIEEDYQANYRYVSRDNRKKIIRKKEDLY